MEIAAQTVLIVGLTLLGAGVIVALLGRLMMYADGDSILGVIMAIFAGAGARVGGWVVMGLGAIVTIVGGVMHLAGS